MGLGNITLHFSPGNISGVHMMRSRTEQVDFSFYLTCSTRGLALPNAFQSFSNLKNHQFNCQFL